MNAHLVRVPCLRALTARRLARCDLELLRGKADGALHAEVLRLGALDELIADLLEGLDVAAGESNANLVNFLATEEYQQCVLRRNTIL